MRDITKTVTKTVLKNFEEAMESVEGSKEYDQVLDYMWNNHITSESFVRFNLFGDMGITFYLNKFTTIKNQTATIDYSLDDAVNALVKNGCFDNAEKFKLDALADKLESYAKKIRSIEPMSIDQHMTKSVLEMPMPDAVEIIKTRFLEIGVKVKKIYVVGHSKSDGETTCQGFIEYKIGDPKYSSYTTAISFQDIREMNESPDTIDLEKLLSFIKNRKLK